MCFVLLLEGDRICVISQTYFWWWSILWNLCPLGHILEYLVVGHVSNLATNVYRSSSFVLLSESSLWRQLLYIRHGGSIMTSLKLS